MQHRIPLILNKENDQQIDSGELLSEFNVSPERKSDERTRVMRGIKDNEPIYLCGLCNQPVYLCGGQHDGLNSYGNSFRTIHFKHYCPNENCPFSSHSNYSYEDINRIKYHGQKEGALHKELKHIIAKALIKEGYNANEEQIVSLMQLCEDGFHGDTFHKYWRKPDVRAEKGDLKFVVEIQLATTFLSVIIERMRFYKDTHHYILWVLEDFYPQEEQKFTTMDILSLTNRNIFVLDKEMREVTKQTERLTLKCYYEVPVINLDKTIRYNWDCKEVHIEDIIFDEKDYIGYYYDSRGEETKLLQQVEESEQEYIDPEENFINIVNTEIKNLYDNQYFDYRNFHTNILNNNIENIERSLYLLNKRKNIPQPSDNFFRSLLALNTGYCEYGQLIRVILPHPVFSYSFNEVFSIISDPLGLAWDLTETCEQLLLFINLFHRSNYHMTQQDFKWHKKALNKNVYKNNTKLLKDDRDIVEKSILIIMWYRIQQCHEYEEYLGMLNCPEIFRLVMRLSAYEIGHPLSGEFSNIQMMTGNILNFHPDFSHLVIKMIEAYDWNTNPKMIKNYNGLKAVPESCLDHRYDELATVLFEK